MEKQIEKKERTKLTREQWIWIGGGVAIILILVAIVWLSILARVFEFVDGPPNLIVIKSYEKEGVYSLRYTGREPVSLDKILINLESRDTNIPIDVLQMMLVKGDQSVILDIGEIPEGETFVLQPGEEFQIILQLKGAVLGRIRLAGFIISYTMEGEAKEYRLRISDHVISVE